MFKKLLILPVMLICTLVSAQRFNLAQTVRGIVIDEQSGGPLVNVTVMTENLQPVITAVSDSEGQFKLRPIPPGRQTIRASCIGYEDAVIRNIEVTSSREVILEIRMREKVQKLEEFIVTADREKNRPLNKAAVLSARQLSMDEAVRYSGTRNDPSRMAQNFAGVSGVNDARNDIIVRGNSPTGVLWRMDGIDIPNPNHFSTIGSTGGPVTILNINTLKNSDFITGAFPAQYGNAVAGVFDLNMRNGNNEKYEFLAQAGFNGFELSAEGPLNKKKAASFLIDYRYSLVATVMALGLDVGTGSAVPYYHDLHYKLLFPTKKTGTFAIFGLGGESHIRFSPQGNQSGSLYGSSRSNARDRLYGSITGVTGISHLYYFNPTTSGKLMIAASGFQFKADEDVINANKPARNVFDMLNRQVKYSGSYNLNKKFTSKNQLTSGFTVELNRLTLEQDEIRNTDSVQSRTVNVHASAALYKAFTNWSHRFSDKLNTNVGLYAQLFALNDTKSLEPRWNIRYAFRENQSLAFAAGLHSQVQQVYFNQRINSSGVVEYPNKNLDFVKSLHTVIAYDFNATPYLRFKSEAYAQRLFDVAVEKQSTSFSMLNAGADFEIPNKVNLVNKGKGYNIGFECTLEKFLHKNFYYLVTLSVFESKYKGSDGVWRNTVFNSNYVSNLLAGKEFKLNKQASLGLDSRLTYAGGQRYTPFDLQRSATENRVVYDESKAFSLQHPAYFRWDLKFSFTRNGRKTTQKWYVDLQNLTNKRNIFMRSLDPSTGRQGATYQIGLFPNINYQITFQGAKNSYQ
jgi:hypothetical protein